MNEDALRLRFEREFHARTLEYLPGYGDIGGPIVVEIAPDAHCEAGHVLVSCLFNMLARAHRELWLVGAADEPLQCRSAFGHTTVGEATVGLARRINPYIIAETVPPKARRHEGFVIGIGRVQRADLLLGADGFIASVGEAARVVDRAASVWGALLSACIGAAAAFHRAAGRTGDLPSGDFSVWDLGIQGGGDGPSQPGPVDVGRVLQAGAGAVACGLDLALTMTGLEGQWAVVDGDNVDVTNLNRQAMFVASDAGWPQGPASAKAAVAARRLGAQTDALVSASARWYGDDAAVVDASYDVVLALANERGVRGALLARQPTVLLHATTSPRWSAQAHRHVSGLDDCISCRIADATPVMQCAAASIRTGSGSSDASLPFLSVTAGVLLAGLLARLQHGALTETRENQVIFDFAEPKPMREGLVASCTDGCAVRLPPDVRRSVDAASRWVRLDPSRYTDG